MFVWSFRGAALIVALCAASQSALGAAAEAPAVAPFRSVEAAHRFADEVVAALVGNDPVSALAMARDNSHRDDPQAQSNLDRVAQTLPEQLQRLGAASSAKPLGEDAFSYAFQRFTYLIVHEHGEQRCMFTFRLKADGWRLNQMYCA